MLAQNENIASESSVKIDNNDSNNHEHLENDGYKESFTLDNFQGAFTSICSMAKPIPNYISAIFKILYDKSKDIISHASEKEENEYSYEMNDQNTNNNIISNLSKFQDETNNNRLYPIEKYKYEEFYDFVNEPTLIIDDLYLGSAFNAGCYYTLMRYNIGLIINVTNEISNYYPQYFQYKNIPIKDNNKDSIQPYLNNIYENIVEYRNNNPNKKILIHCFMGASRSVSVMTFYIMKKGMLDQKPINFDEALEIIKTKRDIANPSFKLAKDVIIQCSDKN